MVPKILTVKRFDTDKKYICSEIQNKILYWLDKMHSTFQTINYFWIDKFMVINAMVWILSIVDKNGPLEGPVLQDELGHISLFSFQKS